MPKKRKINIGEKIKFPAELRFDLISKDWVIIATGRGKRPEMFKSPKKALASVPRKICPFCRREADLIPLLVFCNGRQMPSGSKIGGQWTTAVIANKFPALLPCNKMEKQREGEFYQKMNACGYCELVVTRDHSRHFPSLKLSRVKEIFDAYQSRYLALARKKYVNYVSIFHNHGVSAGASQPHPHSQIITTPLIDVDLSVALNNSRNYFEKHKKCIYCQMNKWERKVRKRVVFENREFLAICPFASKEAFEVIISPKKHLPYFERIGEKEKWQLAEAFQKVMTAIYKGLANPPYNFYLHTAPADEKEYPYYHWHWTILPKTATPAGFELGTRMEISAIEPEKAAEYLKKQIK